jgi:hypothetical protein
MIFSPIIKTYLQNATYFTGLSISLFPHQLQPSYHISIIIVLMLLSQNVCAKYVMLTCVAIHISEEVHMICITVYVLALHAAYSLQNQLCI